MKKPDIKKSFQTRKFKYGGYAALTTAVVLAILLIVNLLVGELNLKVDLTKNQIFSLSSQTKQVLSGLKQNVDIYIFDEAGKEDPMLRTIIEKYQGVSSMVSVQYKDPTKYPQFAKQYSQNGTDVTQGSIVVSSGKKFRLIDPSTLVNYSYDQSGNQVADSLGVENKVTEAIIYATSAETPVIYALKGHEEMSLPSDVTTKIEGQNYTIKDLDLGVNGNTLTDGSTLIIASPQRDLTSAETNTIKDFLAKGGRAVFMMDLQQNDLPNFQSLLSTYGVGIQKAVVIEGNAGYTASQNPLYLVPEMGDQDIVIPLKSNNLPVIIPGAQVIEGLKLKKNSTTIEPLLTTSTTSWAKTNMNSSTINKEASDLTGPFNIAVAITDKASNGGKDTKLVVVSNGLFVSSDFSSLYGNTDFLTNSINWLQDKKDLISITPKSIADESLKLNSLQALLYSGMVVIVIPVIIAVWGISVMLRRKRQ